MNSFVGYKNPSGEWPAYLIPVIQIHNTNYFALLSKDLKEIHYNAITDSKETWTSTPIYSPNKSQTLSLLDYFLFGWSADEIVWISNTKEQRHLEEVIKRCHPVQRACYERRLTELREAASKNGSKTT